MHQCFDSLSLNPNRAQVTRDILRIGDVWAADLETLEMQNAETKRVATTGGSRRIEFTAAGKTVVGVRGDQQGPVRLTDRKAYCTSMTLSTMNNLLSSHAEIAPGRWPIPVSGVAQVGAIVWGARPIEAQEH